MNIPLMLMEQLEYNLLFRWFVGLSAHEAVWHPTVFSKNRDRLLEGAVAEEFFSFVVEQARQKRLLSDDHFIVDGTMIEAWAGQKSFQTRKDGDACRKPPPKDPGRNPTVNYRKQERSNDTHESLTDRFARLFKKSRGSEAKLCYLGHVVTENRHGLVVDTRLTLASGTAERDAVIGVFEQKPAGKRVTLGGDKGYDTDSFVGILRDLQVTPHVAQNNANRRSAIDGRTTRHEGYAVSQRKRKRVEEVFGLDEDDRAAAEDPVPRAGPRSLDVHLRRGSLQLSPDAKSDGAICLKRATARRSARKAPAHADIPVNSYLNRTGSAFENTTRNHSRRFSAAC